MEGKTSFAIGCFHFGLKKQTPFTFTASEYIHELQVALHSLPGVKNITVGCSEEREIYSRDVSAAPPNISDGPDFFPNLPLLEINFDLCIPYTAQAELAGSSILNQGIRTENFRVTVKYTYHFPVTFVEPIKPDGERRPSTAVVVVREFLNKEFAGVKNTFLQFEYLGPSPFHVDCYIEPSRVKGDDTGNPWFYKSECYPMKGYDKVVFYYNPDIIDNAEAAKELIFRDIVDEVGFYYEIVQQQVVMLRSWGGIKKLVDQIIACQQLRGVTGFAKQVFLCPRQMNEATIQMAKLESRRIFFESKIRSKYKEIYFRSRKPCFQTYIDEEIKEQLDYPIAPMNHLISLFEKRRTISVEGIIFLVSAMISGSIGALLTMILSR